MALNYLHDIANGIADIVNVVVEVPKGSRNKYEYEYEEGVFRLDRVLFSPFFYPVDYGFVPRTWYEDDDPLDAMVLVRHPTFTGCVLEARVIGMLHMEDEHGIDDKLLLVPTGDPSYRQTGSLIDVPSPILDEIAHFFKHYKDLEGKTVVVGGWYEKEEALKALSKAKSLYEGKFGKR